ncbi:MAG TPA: hypothetical protein PLJ32_00440 [Kiritimatiellia bacterium]|nr:hypothetical protein [Kiritimatiellia bacterium]HPW74423.1 hypothetical protein [Kiritimatiellia bacterium]
MVKVQMSLSIGLLATVTTGAEPKIIYTWTGEAADGNWFNPTNWSGPSGYGVPGDTHDPANLQLDGAYFESASNVVGTINYTYVPGTTPHTNLFSYFYLNKTDDTPLTFNVNGDLTADHFNLAEPDWYESYNTIGGGGNLTFNVNSGTFNTGLGKVSVNLADLYVASGATLSGFVRPSGNMTITVKNQARIQGRLGYEPFANDYATRNNVVTIADGELVIDGGVLYPDYFSCGKYGMLSVTNGGMVLTRFGGSGIAMNGYHNKYYTNRITVTSGSVTNVGIFTIGGVNTYGVGTPWPGRSIVTVHGGVWFQGGATCLGDGRLGFLTLSGGTFETPADFYVGGGRSVDWDVPIAGVEYSGTLNVDGGTMTVCNPEAYVLQIATLAGKGSSSDLYFGQTGWDRTYRGQRVVFDALKSDGTGLESNRVYFVADINTASTIQKTCFSVETNLTLTKTGVTGTPYNSGTGNNIYHTFPAQLRVGNWMTFKTGTLLNTGTLNLASGSLTADELIATNGTASILSFAGGTLTVKQFTDINNGFATVFGDGESSALLELVAGTHHFADGLVITNNATLAIGGTNAIGSVGLMGGLAFARGAALDVDFSAATNDWLEVGGAVALADEVTLTLRMSDDTARSPVTILKASEGIEGSAGAWPSATVNNIKYRAVVVGDELRLEKVAQGTMVNIL